MNRSVPDERPLKGVLTQNLIENLQRTIDKNELRLSHYEFYYRFSGYIYKCAMQNCRNFSSAELMAKDILQETFINGMKAVKNFKFSDKVKDSGDFDRCVKAWLGRIATNEFLKAKARIENLTYDVDALQFIESSDNFFGALFEEPIEAMPSEDMIKLQTALNQLSERDRHIILTYASEGCIKSDKRLSREKMKYLCETYNTTPENIRQRKTRSLYKIMQICYNSIT
jgi:RNA polymerase sigma factor (sigma-70 family)